MLKINVLRIPLMNQAQTVSGSRGRVMPRARRSMVVTLKLMPLQREAREKSATLAVQRVMPVSGAARNAMVRPMSEAAVAQKESRFSLGKAISRAPICSGRK